MPENPLSESRYPRLLIWLLVTIALLLVAVLVAPFRVPLAAWKVLLVTGGAVLGYWLDRGLFPYARPGDMFQVARDYERCVNRNNHWVSANLAALRRAVIVFACILGLTLGV